MTALVRTIVSAFVSCCSMPTRPALGLVVAVALAAGASPAAAQVCSKQFQLVGFSSSTLNGNEGVFGMTKACQDDFPESRMCTSEEVMNTVTIPTVNGNNAWVRPSLQPIATGAGGAAVVGDISGRDTGISGGSDPGDLSCRGWTDNSFKGLTVNNTGGFSPQPCTARRPVACCSLIRVPEPPAAALHGGAVAAIASLAAAWKIRPEQPPLELASLVSEDPLLVGR